MPQSPGHLSDDDLIASLYVPEDYAAHLALCSQCQNRLGALQDNRRTAEYAPSPGLDVSADFLAAQRRRIYSALTASADVWTKWRTPAWVSAIAATAVLCGGLLVHNRPAAPENQDSISDAQLAQEVSLLAQGSEARTTDPLQGLFE